MHTLTCRHTQDLPSHTCTEASAPTILLQCGPDLATGHHGLRTVEPGTDRALEAWEGALDQETPSGRGGACLGHCGAARMPMALARNPGHSKWRPGLRRGSWPCPGLDGVPRALWGFSRFPSYQILLLLLAGKESGL